MNENYFAYENFLSFDNLICISLFVFRKFSSTLAFLAVFQIMGGHWIVLQTYAWGKMAIEYSKTAGFFKGVEKTFDGEHPCDMCKHLQKETQKDNSDPIKVDLVKLLKQSEILPSLFSTHRITSISFPIAYSVSTFLFSTRDEVPLTPPPLGQVLI